MPRNFINSQRLIDLFIELIEVNTPPRKEAVLIDMIQPRLEALGLICERDAANLLTGGDSGNLIATLKGNVPGAVPIFFSAHFDTVEPTPNMKIIRDGSIIRTDGSTILGADDKGGMAPILEAVQCIVEENIPHGDIQLLLTVSEEIGLLGARYIDQSKVFARHGFVLDTGPPVGTTVFTAPTQNILDIKILGRPAHAGFEPELGISAIEVAARAIGRMRLGRIDSETTANVGIINGGAATNVVCPEVTLRAEARSRERSKLAAQTQHMVDAFETTAREAGAEAIVKVNHVYDTYRLTANDFVIAVATEAALRLGLPTGLREAGGGSDANEFNRFGWQTTVLGTGMRNIHTHEECIDENDLIKSAQWVLEICKLVAEKAGPA